MEKTTLYLDGDDYRKLKRIAAARKQAPASLVREAVAEYVTRHGGSPLPKSLGAGASGRDDLSGRAEDLLGGMGSRSRRGPAVIVADTGAIVALLDRGDRHHRALRALYAADPDAWLLPWAILPEVDYLVGTHLGDRVHRLWLSDLAAGAFAVQWGRDGDLAAAGALARTYASLKLGLVDTVVMAMAERLGADIATLDLRDFGAVTLRHTPRLLPRDL